MYLYHSIQKIIMLDPILTLSISFFISLFLPLIFLIAVSHVSNTDYVILVEQQQDID